MRLKVQLRGSNPPDAKISVAACRPSVRHFHPRYGEFEATIEIGTLSVIDGHLPHRALNLVQEWAMIHREELLFNWLLCREKSAPVKVGPLP